MTDHEHKWTHYPPHGPFKVCQCGAMESAPDVPPGNELSLLERVTRERDEARAELAKATEEWWAALDAPDEDTIETIARALFDRTSVHRPPWDTQVAAITDHYRDHARAVLAALAGAVRPSTEVNE